MIDPVSLGAYATVSIAFSTAAQALTALESLRTQGKISPAAQTHIDELKSALSSLEATGKFLQEAKELHDHLNRVALHVGMMKDFYDRALHNRVFSEDDYAIARVCEIWDTGARDFLDLNNFLLHHIKLISNPITTFSTGVFGGPDWLTVFLRQHTKINNLVKRRERGDSMRKIDFAEEVNILHGASQNALSRANSDIRTSAGDIAAGFLIFKEKVCHA